MTRSHLCIPSEHDRPSTGWLSGFAAWLFVAAFLGAVVLMGLWTVELVAAGYRALQPVVESL